MTVRDPDPAYFHRAVASVKAQTIDDVELVVVEDPGTGGVSVGAAACAGLVVTHVRNAVGAGLAAARNQGIALARADLVAILDGDDECLPDRLERQVGFLDAHPEVAVVGSQIEVVDAGGTRLGYRVYPLDHAAIRRAMRRYNAMAHPAVVFRKSAVLAAGGYGAGGGRACDDYELWSRMALAGHVFANLPQALVRYRLHAGAMKATMVRDTLRDTLRVKSMHWARESGPADRLRMVGERLLLCLPPRLVGALFRWLTLRRRLPQRGAP
jgi:glycosyltransferase involved in cell wall biosynthesis